MTKFLRGTVILLIAGFFTRILGFINRIVIARFIGEEGVGLYMMVFPTLMLVIAITQLGLPVAISKSVAEAEARGDKEKTKKILIVSLVTTLGLSLILTPALMLSAPYLAKVLFTDERTFYPLFAISPIIPIVAVSAVIRGYFQGRQNMKPAAVAQVLEQAVRIGFIIILTRLFIPYGIEFAAAAAMVASVIGELCSFLYLFKTFKLKKTFKLRSQVFLYLKSGKETFLSLMDVALPTMGSRMIGSVAWFFEPIVVTHALALAGVATATATKQYGALTGFALPLLMLPSFITHALSIALVPAISEAHSNGQHNLIEYRLQQALRFVLISGGVSVVILYVLAEPLLQIMYNSTSGVTFIKLMAPLFLFAYFQAPLQATLQALNLARAAMINSLIGAICKITVIFFLASQPAFGIKGAAIGILVSIVVVTTLHYATILKKISFSVYLLDYIKTFFIMIVSGSAGFLLLNGKFAQFSLLLQVLLTTLTIALAYLILLVVLRLFKEEELKRLPYVGKLIVRFFY